MEKKKRFSVLKFVLIVLCIILIVISIFVNIAFSGGKTPKLFGNYVYIVKESDNMGNNVSTGSALIAPDAKDLTIAKGDIVLAYPAADPVAKTEKRRRLVSALWGLLTPLIILGGIFSGLFTPSEAAAIAVDYSLIVAFVIYRSLTWKKFYQLVVGAGVTSALIMFIIATSTLFGWELAFCQAPEQVAEVMLRAAGGRPAMIYLMIMVIILIAGMFMETSSALIVLTPIFIPTIMNIGGNMVHFGLLVTIGLAIGMATPPVAIDLYVASAITGLPMERLTKPIIPMVLVLAAVLLVLTYVPSLTTFLPALMGMK